MSTDNKQSIPQECLNLQAPICGEEPGHYDWITDLAVLDQKTAFTFSADGTIRKWRENTEIMRIHAHMGKVWKGYYDEQGKILYSIGWDGFIRAWNAVNGELLHERKVHENVTMGLGINHSRIITSGWDQTIKVLTRNFAVSSTISISEIPISTEILNDYILVGTKKGNLLVINAHTQEITTLRVHTSFIWRITPLTTEEVITFSYDGTAKRVSITERKVIQTYTSPKEPLMGGGTSENLVHGGSLLGELFLWDMETGELILNKKIHDKALLATKTREGITWTGSRDRSGIAFRIENNNINIQWKLPSFPYTPKAAKQDAYGSVTGYWEKFALYCQVGQKVPRKLTGEFSGVRDVALTPTQVFLITADRKLVAYNRETGALQFMTKTPGIPLFLRVTEESNLIILLRDGKILRATLKTRNAVLEMLENIQERPVGACIHNKELRVYTQTGIKRVFLQ